MKALMRGAVHSYLEYAIDYASAGMYDEAAQLLSFVTEDAEVTYPMVTLHLVTLHLRWVKRMRL